MVCIYCGQKTRVTNSRSSLSTKQVWRRRQCIACQSIYSTTEKPDYSGSLVVEAEDGELTPFYRDKVYLSVYKSCKHRPSAINDSALLTNTIISKLLKHDNRGQLTKADIATVVLKTLNRFDKSAMVYYQAYHPEF